MEAALVVLFVVVVIFLLGLLERLGTLLLEMLLYFLSPWNWKHISKEHVWTRFELAQAKVRKANSKNEEL